MKHIKLYEDKVYSKYNLNNMQRSFLANCIDGTWKFNKDGEVDIIGNFLNDSDWYPHIEGFMGIRFNNVEGDFCVKGTNIKSLEGVPKNVTGTFEITKNHNLTSLKGCPKETMGSFNCSNNVLTSLEGCPETIGKGFSCANNKLTNLIGGPKKIAAEYNKENIPVGLAPIYSCIDNKLTTLEGAPEELDSDFDCRLNQLTTLKNGPKKVKYAYKCSGNKLTTLEGAPKKVGRFSCVGNQLRTLEGGPDIIENTIKPGSSNYACEGNPIIDFKGAPKEIINGHFTYGDVSASGVSNNIFNIFLVETWTVEGILKQIDWFNEDEIGSRRREIAKVAYTLIDPEYFNELFTTNPGKAIMMLKNIWNNKGFERIRNNITVPEKYKNQFALVVDLKKLGF